MNVRLTRCTDYTCFCLIFCSGHAWPFHERFTRSLYFLIFHDKITNSSPCCYELSRTFTNISLTKQRISNMFSRRCSMLSRQMIYTNMCKLLLTDTRFHTDEIVLVMSCSSVQCWCSSQTFKHISGVNSYTCRIHINICNYISEGGVWGGRGWWAIGFHQGAGGWREALGLSKSAWTVAYWVPEAAPSSKKLKWGLDGGRLVPDWKGPQGWRMSVLGSGPPKQCSHVGKTHFFKKIQVFRVSRTMFYLHGSSVSSQSSAPMQVKLTFSILKSKVSTCLSFSCFSIIFGSFWRPWSLFWHPFEAFVVSFGALVSSF